MKSGQVGRVFAVAADRSAPLSVLCSLIQRRAGAGVSAIVISASRALKFASRRLDDAAAGLWDLTDLVRRKTLVTLLEQADGGFIVASKARAPRGPVRFEAGRFTDLPEALVKGADVEVRLQARRFLFRSLEVPRKAADFLDAVVHAQIDRLTPWSPAQAAFGRSAPAELAGDRLGIVVAATSRADIAPFALALESMAPRSVTISAASEGQQAPIVVRVQRTQADHARAGLRRWLIAPLALAWTGALAVAVLWLVLGANLDASRIDIERQFAQRRAELAHRGAASDGPAAELTERKRQATPAVFVIEALSRALPDDAYLTDMKISGDRIEIAGFAPESARLIDILERSAHFQNATFTAPTTRAPNEAGEQFQIEARVAPRLALNP